MTRHRAILPLAAGLAVLAACTDRPTATSDPAAGPARAATAALAVGDWASGNFRYLGSMPQPDGYDLDGFAGNRTLMPRPITFDTITPTRTTNVRALMKAVLDASAASVADPNTGAWCSVRSRARAAGYLVRRFYDTESGRYLVYGQDTLTGSQQAYFLVNPAYKRNVVVEVPHEPVDPGTGVEGARVFRDLAARVLVVNGAHRCASPTRSPCDGKTSTCGGFYRLSDPAHHRANTFHAFHLALDDRGARFAQLHRQRSVNHVVADDGTTNTGDASSASVTFLDKLRRVLDPTGTGILDDSVVACQTPNQTPVFNPTTGQNGCYATNVQARYTHQQADPAVTTINSCTMGSAYGADRRVLLIEQTNTASDGDCGDGYCWRRVSEALKQTWPCNDGTTSCGIGAAQPKYADKACP
jgi:hypothetical protein